jgi:hypothetical protein
VRVQEYADLRKLAEEVTTIEDTTGNQLDMLKDFVGDFSSSFQWFDFVDVNQRLIAAEKISGMLPIIAPDSRTETSPSSFIHHAKDARCKHIFFGASGPDPYIEVLRTHEGYHHKVTLIRGNKIDTQEALCLKMVSLSCIHSYKYYEVAANHEEVEPMEDLESSSSAEQNHVSLPNR